jgi:hypothetical protein
MITLLLSPLLLLACRPDPGLPDYPAREPWVITGDDFYDDPYAEGEERLSIGVFYESVATESYPIDDSTTHFYVYSDTFSVTASDDRIEGYASDRINRGTQAWWGGGVHWDSPRDLSDWDTLHVAVQTTTMTDWSIGLTGGGVESRVDVTDYGLVADGDWHVLDIPTADFDGADLRSVTVALLLVGASGNTGDNLLIDDVYYTRGGAR